MNIKLTSNNYASLEYLDNQKRDVLFILPGGGYGYASEREGGPVANAFKDLGLHTCIYYYRETLLLYPEIHQEAAELLDVLKKDPLINNIHVIGFSAGGHFALMLLEKYSSYFKTGILCYPVVSIHQKLYHGDSFKRLMGHKVSDALKAELSLEMHVHNNIPPVFIFHTIDDSVVPIGNSLVLIEALNNKDITVEVHLYPHGRHGISIATEEVAFAEMTKKVFVKKYGYLNEWVQLAKVFLKRYMA